MATLNDQLSEDPFDWSIDQVVHQFCHSPRPVWSPEKLPQHLPTSATLEKALRDNDVDGENLLALDDSALKHDIGIVSFGQRRAVLKAIFYLRNLSRKYLQPSFHADALARLNSGAFATPQMTASHISPFAHSPGINGYGFALPDDQQAFASPRFDSHSDFPQPLMPMTQSNTLLLQATASPRRAALRPSVTSPNKFTPTPQPHHIIEPGDREQDSSNLTDNTTYLSSNSRVLDDTDNSGREIPLADLHIDKSTVREARSIPEGSRRHGAGISRVIEQERGYTNDQSSDNKYTIVDGRRRLAPTLISHILKERVGVQQAVSMSDADSDSQPTSSDRYLHHSAQDIADIIYHLPKEIGSGEFSFSSSRRPPGQRQSVAALMKHALLQPAKSVPGSRSHFKFLYPASSLVYSDDPKYFTMFSPGFAPAVRNLDDWLGIKASLVIPRKRGRNKDVVEDIPTKQSAAGDVVEDNQSSDLDIAEFKYLLEKYPVMPDDKDVLPEYGDSGDEGEYDEETWQEMVAEHEERQQEQKKGPMRKIDVEQALDEAIVDLKTQWRQEKFPKAQVKAYRLWFKAAREKRRDAEMSNAGFWINRFDKAIAKIRKAISEDVWFNTKDVKDQGRSLEESVFQREEYLHLIEVLAQTHPPSRPDTMTLLRARRKEQHSMPDGEELLESDSDISLQEFIEEETSDGSSIPHDAPNTDVDASLAHLREEAAAVRAEQVALQTELNSHQTSRHESPELGSRAAGRAHYESEASTRSRTDSESSDDIIVTPAYRKIKANHFVNPVVVDGDAAHGDDVTDSEDDRSRSDEENEGETAQDSDLDLPRLPRTQYRERGRTQLQAIDLTLSSSPSRATETDNDSTTGFDVTTPDLNPPDEHESRPKLKFMASRAKSSLSASSASSPRLLLSGPSDTSGLPGLENVQEIRELDWDEIYEESDRRRALAKAVYDLDRNVAKDLREYVATTLKDQDKLRGRLREALMKLNHKGTLEQKTPHRKAFPLLFITFVCHANMMDETQIPKADVQEAWQSIDSAQKQFYGCLLLTLDAYIGYVPEISRKHKRKLADYEPETELADDSDIFAQTTDSDVGRPPEEPSSLKKRKREVKESQEAKFQQLNDQQRVKEEQARKAIMAKKLLAMDVTGDDPSTKVINTREPLITLDPHIGRRVKPHQVDGISFMWREIVADPKQQGCLLAHTMGLGKTMQVISLLCTIAQSVSSPDPAIRNQIPKELRQIRALILCPPSLIDNWYDELLMWIPTEELLGPIYKLSSKTTPAARIQAIRTWADGNGVVLLSYDMFRLMVSKKQPNLSAEEYQDLEDNLLNSPNIIVADEAHKMKNASSMISMVAKKFRSFSRIALTGSPLNNHLEEYHTMIDWIAPGYLGSLVQFKAKYSEPISDGLYHESSAYERRVALRKLHVLKRDLDPKINRADISAVAKDMPSKTEFFITIPLTPLQERAYNTLMDHILQPNASTTSNARLWSWIDVFKLLCNHPYCFVRKLELLNEGAESTLVPKIKTTSDDEDLSEAPEDAPLSDLELSVAVREHAIQVFDELDWGDILGLVELSHRAHIVKQIIEEAKRIGDKVLLFSHSIPTLDYLESLIDEMGCKYARIDGTTTMSTRQDVTKVFNSKKGGQQVFLISMQAGGLGLNLPGANRVIIYDFSWNPSWEEQAIGRAYRLGQKKPVFVYRFRAGGTYEDVLYNKSVFKTQLFERVVDKKNYYGRASKSVTEYLFHARDVPLQDFTISRGKDPEVLDRIIDQTGFIRNIELTETFQKEEDEDLTPDEQRAADEEYQDQVLERDDPEAYRLKKLKQQQQMLQHTSQAYQQPPAQYSAPSQSAPTARGFGNAVGQSGVKPAGGKPHPWSISSTATFGGFGPPALDRVYDNGRANDDVLVPPAGRDVPMPDASPRASSPHPSGLPQMDGANDDPDEFVRKSTNRDECAPQ